MRQKPGAAMTTTALKRYERVEPLSDLGVLRSGFLERTWQSQRRGQGAPAPFVQPARCAASVTQTLTSPDSVRPSISAKCSMNERRSEGRAIVN
jgi:hypothetical protein